MDPALARLHHGMLQKASYIDPHTQAEVSIFFHHPTLAEKSAACGLVGLEFGEDGMLKVSESCPIKGGGALSALIPSAHVKLATLCIESVDGVAWPEQAHEEAVFGLPQITDVARKLLYPPALVTLGAKLFEWSEGSEDEKKD